MGAKVITMYPNGCLECKCGSHAFHVLTDGVGDEWTSAIGTECVECGERIMWEGSDHD